MDRSLTYIARIASSGAQVSQDEALWEASLSAYGNGDYVESLSHLPDWLSHLLIELDNAGDWDTANRILQRLHYQLWAEVQLIPLWEINDFMVIRKNINGLSTRPLHPYQNIERWIVEPWYPNELP